MIWFEVLAILAMALLWPVSLPVALPLMIAGSISRAIRRRPWSEVSASSGARLLAGAIAGAVSLAMALLIGTQSLVVLFAQSGERIVEIAEIARATGELSHLAIAVLAVGIVAFAFELALRGWVVERVLELSPGSPVLPVLIGAFVEAIVTPGDPPARAAAAVFGAGLGWLYIAGQRSILAPVVARVAFQCGAVVLEAFRLG